MKLAHRQLNQGVQVRSDLEIPGLAPKRSQTPSGVQLKANGNGKSSADCSRRTSPLTASRMLMNSPAFAESPYLRTTQAISVPSGDQAGVYQICLMTTGSGSLDFEPQETKVNRNNASMSWVPHASSVNRLRWKQWTGETTASERMLISPGLTRVEPRDPSNEGLESLPGRRRISPANEMMLGVERELVSSLQPPVGYNVHDNH